MTRGLSTPAWGVAFVFSAITAADVESVLDLTGSFEVSGPTISHHLRVLREAGLVDCERRGTWVYYWARTQSLRGLAAHLDGAAIPA